MGFGCLLITLFLSDLQDKPIVLFCMAIILCAVLEYFTSYIMEKVFHARWWDYSNEKLNLNGRICIRTLIPFGILGIIVIYLINPVIFRFLNYIPLLVLHILSGTTFTIIIIDFIVSMHAVSKVTKTAKKLSQENPKDDTDQITKDVKKELKKTFTGNRLVNAFPDFKAFKIKIKETAIKSKEVIIQKAEKGKEVIQDTIKIPAKKIESKKNSKKEKNNKKENNKDEEKENNKKSTEKRG